MRSLDKNLETTKTLREIQEMKQRIGQDEHTLVEHFDLFYLEIHSKASREHSNNI